MTWQVPHLRRSGYSLHLIPASRPGLFTAGPSDLTTIESEIPPSQISICNSESEVSCLQRSCIFQTLIPA